MTILSNTLPAILVAVFLSWLVPNDEKTVVSGPSYIDEQEHFCANDELTRLLFFENPSLEAFHQRLENEAYEYMKNQSAGGQNRSFPVYTLPVVVHIIHNNGPENISDALVLQGIQHLNESFANTGYYDQGTGIDTQIEFCLAQRDPDGNATTGITRDVSALTDMTMETEDIAMKDINRWDPLNYINIWIVNEICSNSIGCGVAGYAYFPSSHGGANDGIVIEAGWMGSSNANSAVLSHEMGHYLGLYHTFQGGCTNNDCLMDGDRVCDTPPDQSTAAVPCNATANSCTTDVNPGDPNNPFNSDQNDMFWNYMDYGDWSCYSAFTAGQASRMEFFINGTRSSLLTSEACMPACMSPLTASFNSSANPVNIGSTVNFNNTSIGATGYEWLIDGLPFSTNTNAAYTFPAEGFYVITLNTTNNDPNCFETYSDTIEVTCPVIADFTASTAIAQTNEVVVITNNSSNASGYEWTLNGASQGSSVNFSFSLTNPAVVQVCLEATGPLCDDTHCEFISIISDAAAGCDLTYIKTLGTFQESEGAQVILPALDGDIFIAGNKGDSCLLMKISPDGIPVWSRTFKFTNQSEEIYDMILDSDNRLVAVGNGGLSGGNTDCFAFKYDHINDNVEWGRIMSEGNDSRFWTVLEKNAGGDYIVTGQTSPNGSPGLGCDAFAMELDRNSGTVQWMNNYNLGSCESAVDAIIDGNTILLTGRFNNAGGGTSEMRGSLTRIDFSGNELWSRLYLVPTSTSARIYSREVLVDNGSLINISQGDDAGTSTTNVEFHLYSTDMNGNIQWARNLNIPSGNTERVEGLVSLPDGYLVFGHYAKPDNQLFLVKTDKQGQIQWSKSYGSIQNETTAGIIIHDGFIYLLGNRGTGFAEDIYLAKLNMDGELSEPCNEISVLQIDEMTITNAYDGFHPLTVYDPSLTTDPLLGENAVLTAVNETEICSVADCCTNNTYVKTIGSIEFDEGGSTIIPSGDGHLFIAGNEADKALIMKVNANGELIWQRSFDFVSGPDRIYQVFIDSENYMLGVGRNNNVGVAVNFIFKYDHLNNNFIWIQELSSPNESRFTKILEPVAGQNYRMIGMINPNGSPGGGCDAFIAEIDRNSGASLTMNQFHLGNCEIFSDAQIYNNEIFTGGIARDGAALSEIRAAIGRYDLSGNQQWTRLYPVATNLPARTYINSLIIDENENAVIGTGRGDPDGSSATDINWYLYKTNMDGTLQWVKEYAFNGSISNSSSRVINLPDGYLIAGWHGGGANDPDIFIVKTNKTGTVQWAKGIGGGGNESLGNILLFDGFIFITGSSNSFGTGDQDIFLAKLNLDGAVGGESCDNIEDLDIGEMEFPNPYQAVHLLSSFNENPDLVPTGVEITDVDFDTQDHCFTDCLEICNNGVDDDGDALIDYYDPDCPCADTIGCGTPFYNSCVPDCEFPVPVVPFEMETLWSKPGIRVGNGQVVADVNGDCIPDILAVNASGTAIEIVNSASGGLQNSFPANIPNGYSHPALGDVDNDGMAEIFFVNASNGNLANLVRLDYVPGSNSLVETWQSSAAIYAPWGVPAYNYSPGLADFDHNGFPEIYVGNQIFDSQSGLELINGGQNNQGIYLIGASNFMTSTSVAADVLPDADCVFCQGLELIAGGQVYTVNIASYTNPALNDLTVGKEYQLPGTGRVDGATRLVDFDKDGDLDVVVSTQSTATSGVQIFVWDILSETLVGTIYSGLPNPSSERIGPAAIGDVDNDGWPEIVLSTSLNFNVLEDYQNGGGVNWGTSASTLKASISTTDQSGATGTSIFDLNGDGAVEIIYRDESNLRVFDGNLNELSSFPCTSGTATEYPLVADINGDGETEFLCGCNDIGLTAFRSASLPWVKSRKIWNQYNYFVTNVHDDGSIPVQQQNPHLVGDGVIMNGFLVQQPILDEEGTPINPAPDAELLIDSAACDLDTINVYVTICNYGEYTLTEWTPVAVYLGDPTSSSPQLITTVLLGVNLEPDSCFHTYYAVPGAINQPIFVVVNDDGSGNFPYDLGSDFPVTSIGECDFENNIGDIEVNGDVPPVLDLGPDVVVCDNGVFEFNAGSGFDHYEWQDGSVDSTFTSWAPGTFWVRAWNDCGAIQSDTVQVEIDSATVFDLGLDTILCGGGSLTFSVPGYDRYEWLPNVDIDCDSCETVTVTPAVSTTYTLVASLDIGCISVDSIEIIVADTFFMEIDTSICEGETFTFDGMELEPNTSTFFNYNSVLGCDSTILVQVNTTGNETYYEEIDTFACSGSSIVYNGISIPADSTHVFEYMTIEGCDSTILVQVHPLDTFYTVFDEAICEGESILIFGNEESAPGNYSMTYNAANGCDSTVMVVLEVFDAPEVSLVGEPSCPDDSTGSVSVIVNGGNGTFIYNWNTTSESVDELQGIPAGVYEITVSDTNNCTDTASIAINDVTEVPVTGQVVDISCFGASDGLFMIDQAFSGYSFSLDGIQYQNTLSFTDLGAGTYDLYIQDPDGCEYTQSFVINEPPPLILSLPQDTVIELGDAIEIESIVNTMDSLVYIWEPPVDLSCTDCPAPVAAPLENVLYTLTVIDTSGCEAREDIFIRLDKKRNIFIPNVFSPNFDGFNDVFMIFGGKGVGEILVFTVFDRWGEQLFEARNFQPNDPAYGWDGTFKGEDMNPAVFVYFAEVEFIDGRRVLYKGSVTLVK